MAAGRFCNAMRHYGALTCGLSSKWWSEKHNLHHAFTNVVGVDEDIMVRDGVLSPHSTWSTSSSVFFLPSFPHLSMYADTLQESAVVSFLFLFFPPAHLAYIYIYIYSLHSYAAITSEWVESSHENERIGIYVCKRVCAYGTQKKSKGRGTQKRALASCCIQNLCTGIYETVMSWAVASFSRFPPCFFFLLYLYVVAVAVERGFSSPRRSAPKK